MTPIPAQLAFLVNASPPAADPAQVTANLDMRDGRGSSSPVMLTILAGTVVDLVERDSGTSWCAITGPATRDS